MKYSRPHTKLFWVAWLALSISLAICGDVIEDILIDEVDIPISADASATQDIENPAEDVLLSPRFIAFTPSNVPTAVAIEGMNMTATTFAHCVVLKRSWAKDQRIASPPGSFLTPLRI
jgi:hypothetical protein